MDCGSALLKYLQIAPLCSNFVHYLDTTLDLELLITVYIKKNGWRLQPKKPGSVSTMLITMEITEFSSLPMHNEHTNGLFLTQRDSGTRMFSCYMLSGKLNIGKTVTSKATNKPVHNFIRSGLKIIRI